jgi:hypothetical protein
VAGASPSEARVALETVADAPPATAAALASGELSLAQAREVVAAERAAPGSEAALLRVARSESLRGLKDAARKVRVAAIDVEELHRRQRLARSVRHWRDELGMVCFAGALTPEVGVPFVTRLDAETDRMRRAGGRVEPREAYAAEAFAALVSGGGGGRGARADVVYVCDVRAARRGHAHPGEPCHVVGGGPVPVSLIDDVADPFVKAVLHDGVRIETVAHYGRHIPAHLRTALELGAVPELDGVRCVELGCHRRYGLEWDHVDPVANGGRTELANLVPRCWPHHREKTERDRRAGLLHGREPP